MAQWDHGGGFSLNACRRIKAHDRHGQKRLLRYCARPRVDVEYLAEIDTEKLFYHLSMPIPDGRTQIIHSQLEQGCVDAIEALQ